MTKKKTTKSKLKNYIALVLDQSSSMFPIREDVRLAHNSMVRTIKERSEQEGQQTQVALITFADLAKVVYYPTDARNVKEMGPNDYRPDGWTALFDGVGLATEAINGVGDDASFLVLAFTDGDENRSLTYDSHRIRRLFEEKQGLGNWTFAFQLPPGRGANFALRFGIPADNIREWEATSKGTQEVQDSTTVGLSAYFTARSAGEKSVRAFYDVTTDLSKVTATKVKRELDDLSANFKLYTVQKESSVREFIEERSGVPYVIGSTYYQLTKTEKIQPTKGVLLMKKGEKAIYGGQEARDLIGLPTDGSHARVEPGNMGEWDIYVESRSVNRVLVRGTRVLFDANIKKGRKPTWDAALATNK